MSRVDRSALEGGLRILKQDGVILDWSAKDFGMYSIRVSDDEFLIPDVKDTAMWTLGALHAHAMADSHAQATALQSECESFDGDFRELSTRGLQHLQTMALLT